MPDTLERDTLSALERRARQAQALVDVSRDIRYDQPLSDVLASLAVNIVQHTRASSVAATLLHPADLSSIAYGEVNVPPGYTDAMVALRQEPREAAQLRRAAAEGRTWVLRDARNSMLSRPAYAPMADMIRQVAWETVVGTAFEYRPEAMAVVYLCYDSDVDVDEEEVSFARAIAHQTAPAMDNAWLFSEAQRLTAELEALHRADAALSQSLRLQDVLETMTELAVDLIGAEATVLATWGGDGLLHIASSRGMAPDRAAALEERYRVFDRGRQPFAGSREAALIEDAGNDWRVDAEMRALSGVESIAVLTVYAGDDVFGYFHLGWRERHRFTASEERLLGALAVRAGLAVQNALVFEQSNERADQLAVTVNQLEALRRADAAMHESLRLDHVQEAMAALAIDLLGADQGALVTWDAADRLTVRASRGLTADQLDRLNRAYQGYERAQFSNFIPEVAFVEDVRVEARLHRAVRENSPSESIVELPVAVGGQLFGFFTVGYRQRRVFEAADRELFDTLATRAGLAIQNALTYEQSNARADELAGRMRQLEALRRAEAALHRSLRLQDVYEAMVDLAMDLAGADRSLIIAWNEDERLHAYAARGIGEAELARLNDIYHKTGKDVFEGRAPEILIMEDVPNDLRMNWEVRAITPSRSTVDIPVVVNGELFGLFVISWTRPHAFSDDDRTLFDTLATRTALAIQNALLYEQIAAQAVELEAQIRQLEALRTIAANLTLEPAGSSVYDELAGQVVRATSALACAVIVLEEENKPGARMLGTAGLPPGFAPAMNDAYLLGAGASGDDGISAARPTVLPEGRHTSLADHRFARAREIVADAEWEMLVSRPLIYQERRLGALVAGYPAGWKVDDVEISFLAAIADQGAVAVANARLMEAASTLATVEERQRLARELHDSVSQALYGIALGARTARRRLGDTGDPLVVEAVEYVLALAEAGLTETRALIFELIPESLANEGLAVAVKRQAAAIQARHQIPVHIDLGDEPDLPLKTKEAIYRIAQESLNNLAKHAKAENAYVTLACVDGLVRLEVRDDGAGFDPAGDFPGHLGLVSMQERARRIGATYAIESSPGNGATVTLTVPAG